MPRSLNMTRCPHCGSACKTAKTEQMTPTYREITYVCTNPDCGFVFVGGLSPVRSLEASKRPDPEIHIPFRGAA